MNKNIRFLLIGFWNHEGSNNLGMARSISDSLAQRRGSYDYYEIQIWDIEKCEQVGEVTGDITDELANKTEFSAEDLHNISPAWA